MHKLGEDKYLNDCRENSVDFHINKCRDDSVDFHINNVGLHFINRKSHHYFFT